MHPIDLALAKKVLDTVDKGLVAGLGNRRPGEMCVEAAVCFAMGLPHSDNPPCVGYAVRAFKIKLNDARWSSNAARAKGMRKVAIAQLGSKEIDQKVFTNYMVVETVRQILPIALRAIKNQSPEIKEAIRACELVDNVKKAATAANLALTCTDAYAAAYAADAADAADAGDAGDAAYEAAYAARAAAYEAAYAARDKVLSLSASIAVDALKAQNCEGCKFLYLCD